MRRYLNLDPYYYASIHSFTLANTHITTTEALTSIALLIYGTYMTTNALRHLQKKEQQYSPEYAYDMLVQNIRNGASGHKPSSTIIDSRWIPNSSETPIPRIQQHS